LHSLNYNFSKQIVTLKVRYNLNCVESTVKIQSSNEPKSEYTVSKCISSFAITLVYMNQLVADIVFLPCGLFLSSVFYFFFYSLPNLSGCRVDVYHTSTHGVALVQI